MDVGDPLLAELSRLSLFALFKNHTPFVGRVARKNMAGGVHLTGWRGVRQRMTVSRRGSRLLVLMCLMVSIWTFSYATKFEKLDAQFEFRKLTMNSVNTVNLRIRNYAQILAGTAAHLGAQKTVDVRALENYVAGLDLARNAPGIVGFGFVAAAPMYDTADMARLLTAGPEQDRSFRSRNPATETLLWTYAMSGQEAGAFAGFSRMVQEEVRAALEFSRSSRETVLVRCAASPVSMVQQVELLLVHAIFTPASSEEGKAGRFVGWVVTPFSVSAILGEANEVLGSLYDLRVFHGALAEPEHALFDNTGAPLEQGMFQQNYSIEQFGSLWLLEFVSTPKFDAVYGSYFPYFLLVMGLIFTLFVHSALKAVAMRHRSLKLMAELRARQLGAREAENRSLLDSSVSVVMLLDEEGQITFANDGAASLFHTPRESFEGRAFTSFAKPAEGEKLSDLCNAQGLTPEGRQLMLDVQTNTWRTAEDAVQTTVLIRDATEQIKSRMEIEALHKRYDTALTGAGIGVFEIDRTTGKVEMSETWHKIMGTAQLERPFDRQRDFAARGPP